MWKIGVIGIIRCGWLNCNCSWIEGQMSIFLYNNLSDYFTASFAGLVKMNVLCDPYQVIMTSHPNTHSETFLRNILRILQRFLRLFALSTHFHFLFMVWYRFFLNKERFRKINLLWSLNTRIEQLWKWMSSKSFSLLCMFLKIKI